MLPILLVFIVGGLAGFFINQKFISKSKSPETKKDKYIAFVDEVYGIIKDNYWNKFDDKELTDLFVKASEQISGQIQTDQVKDKNEMEKKILEIINKYDSDDKKKEFVATLSNAVLQNLDPKGRSSLYTQKDEAALANNVNNINPGEDLYKDLGVSKDATQDEIDKAYQEKSQENPDLAQNAFNTLSDPVSRRLYDTNKIESTMEYRVIGSSIYYIKISKFSPTTVDELQRVGQKVKDNNNLDTLIVDLRGNIGGAIDNLPFFLGPFIGYDQYAYQFFHQGDKIDFKTKTDFLPEFVKYKKVVFLVDNQTQSTAEVMAATVKKYHVGVVVGATTKGWGTVEKIFNLNSQIADDENYSIFLVHSLTLREDGNPIEGRGVDPNIDTNDPNWKKELYSYFNSNEIVNAIDNLIQK